MKLKTILLPLFAAALLAGFYQSVSAGNALHRASLTGNIAEVKNQLDAGEDPNSVDDNGATALMAAAGNGHAEIVKVLLWGTNPIVEWLLEKDINPTNLWFSVIANPNAADGNGDTALHSAAYFGHAEVAKVLFAAGANVDAANNYGETALNLAKYRGYSEVVRILRFGAKSAALIEKELEFVKLAEQGNLAEVKRLLADGINPNAVNEYDWTALHRAAQAGHAEIVKVLLSAGADVNATNKFGDDTALSLAKNQGHAEIVRILEEAGAEE